jgi:hypothetical protein
MIVLGMDTPNHLEKRFEWNPGSSQTRKLGLVITTSHTLMNFWADESSSFGENFDGLHNGKVVIGVSRTTFHQALQTETKNSRSYTSWENAKIGWSSQIEF